MHEWLKPCRPFLLLLFWPGNKAKVKYTVQCSTQQVWQMEEVWRQVQPSSGEGQVGVAVQKISECVHVYILASHSPQALCSFVQFIDTDFGILSLCHARWQSHSQIFSVVNLILPDPLFAGWVLGMRLHPKKNVVCSLHVYWVGIASSTCSLVRFPVWVYSYKDNPETSNQVTCTCTCDTSTALVFEVADSLREEGGMLAALATLPCCCFGAMGFPLANFSGWDG